MARLKLQHPSRAILVHMPTALLDKLDAKAREIGTTRSHLIRQALAESMLTAVPKPADPAEVDKRRTCGKANLSFKSAWSRIKLG